MPTVDIFGAEHRRLEADAKRDKQLHLLVQLKEAAASGKLRIRLIDGYYEHLMITPSSSLSYYEAL